MEIIIILVPLALLLGGFFLASFIWATKVGQYDDLEGPSFRMLLDDQKKTNKTKPNLTEDLK